MPIDYVLEKGGAFVHIKATGHVTSEELNTFLVRLGSDPELESDHVSLFEATEVTSESLEDINFEKALEIERSNPEKLVARKLAIVVTRGSLYPLAMKYKYLAPTVGEVTHVFTELGDALLWLSY